MKRYDFDGHECEHPKGGYVRYADVEALVAAARAAEAALREIAAMPDQEAEFHAARTAAEALALKQEKP